MKKNEYGILIPLGLFFLISLVTVYSASMMLSLAYKGLILKQLIWYLVGFLVIYVIMKFKPCFFIDKAYYFYAAGIISLALLLIFGSEINGSKCWFQIPGIGSIQPSEFMKIILVLTLSKTYKEFNKKHPLKSFKDDLNIILLTLLITAIPSILTFLQPDTGMVMIYFLIATIMLFTVGIRKTFFIVGITITIIFISVFLYFFFNYQDIFINVLGTKFFYRIDRLLDWSNQSGMQLTNALAAIKAAGLTGFGIAQTPIYFPEPHTDFIFSIFASNFGLIGCIILIIIIIIFDLSIININEVTTKKEYKYTIIGFAIILIYQQIQNIGMNIGLLPIMGITLPFISYGGSSLLSYMVIIGIVMGISKIKEYN